MVDNNYRFSAKQKLIVWAMDEQEQELRRLRRQHRILLNDKHALKGAHGMRAERQQRLVEAMRKQLADLRMELTSTQRPIADRQQVAQLQRTLQAHDAYMAAIAERRHAINELDEQIKDMQLKVIAVRKARATHQHDDAQESMVLKRCENALETHVKRYCTILAENKSLREEVMSLLRDRQLFNAKFAKMTDDLQSGKRQLLETMDAAKGVYDQREESLAKLHILTAKSQAIHVNHIEHMCVMRRHLSAQSELGRFMRAKGARRLMHDLERKEADKRRTTMEVMHTQLETYRAMIDSIRDFVGETNIDRIATIFLRKENENFALFNYVNVLNGEIEALGEQTGELQVAIDTQREQQAREAAHQQEALDALSAIYTTIKTKADAGAQQLALYEHSLTALIAELRVMFDLVQCDDSPLLHLLGQQGDMNIGNVLMHLEIFESKLATSLLSTGSASMATTTRRHVHRKSIGRELIANIRQ